MDTDVEKVSSLAIDASGNGYVAQAEGPVLVFLTQNSTGTPDRQASIEASAIAVDPHPGNVFLSEAQSPYAIVDMDPHLRLIRTIAATQAAPASQLLVYERRRGDDSRGPIRPKKLLRPVGRFRGFDVARREQRQNDVEQTPAAFGVVRDEIALIRSHRWFTI